MTSFEGLPYTFQRERVHEIFEELKPLLIENWRETGSFKHLNLEPDFERYQQIEESGILRTFTARDRENQLVGYAIFIVSKHLHYKSSLQAAQDVIYIHPGHRGYGRKFIEWIDEFLKNEGVGMVIHETNDANKFASLLERIGYEFIGLVYARRLV